MAADNAAAYGVPPGRTPSECITRSQVVEGTTAEACLAALKEERESLQAKGLVDAEPVLVVTANGQILRGMTTATSTGWHGRVEVTDGKLACSADYSTPPSQTFSIPFRCTDGRTGVGDRAWFFLGQGEGVIRMSDGETARYAFGCSTRVGDVRTCPVVQAGQPLAVQPIPPAPPQQNPPSAF